MEDKRAVQAPAATGASCFGCRGDVTRWCGRCRRTGVEPALEVLAQACAIVALRLLGIP